MSTIKFMIIPKVTQKKLIDDLEIEAIFVYSLTFRGNSFLIHWL